MEARLGTRSFSRAFLAGVILTFQTNLTPEPSPRTGCYRIRSIYIMLVRACIKLRMAERAGRKFLADRSHHTPTTMQPSNPFPAKQAISSLREDGKVIFRQNRFIDQPMVEQHGQPFPMLLK